MSKEHTALPMQSLSVDEKHDPISGHASPTTRNTSAAVNGGSNGRDYLPVGNNKASPEKKLHPAVIISLWIFMSASVIGEFEKETCTWYSSSEAHRFPLHDENNSIQQG